MQRSLSIGFTREHIPLIVLPLMPCHFVVCLRLALTPALLGSPGPSPSPSLLMAPSPSRRTLRPGPLVPGGDDAGSQYDTRKQGCFLLSHLLCGHRGNQDR
jgi:hypothetical protein